MTLQNRMSGKAGNRDTKRTAIAGAPCPGWHERFLSMLPSIRQHAEFCFRGAGAESRQELVQETIARSLYDYVRLLQRGKGQVGQAGPLPRYAVAQVRQR
jgi:hypothetical protein